jgi:hypothetical protein
MSRLIAAVMAIAVLGSALAFFAGRGPLLLRLLALTVVSGPALLAGMRVVPNAVRLGARKDDLAKQTSLARAICRDHIMCLAGVAAFLAVEFSLAFSE